jgi:hypothetical protein
LRFSGNVLKFELVYQYPVWFGILCLFAGFSYAWFLYRNRAGFIDAPVWVKRILPILRGLSVSILCFLLLAPLLKLISREEEQPLVILLHDNSASLAGTQASEKKYLDELDRLKQTLGEKFELKSYTFSEHLNDSFKLDYKGRETDMALALEEISNLFENRNTGAVILAGDGIFNRGIHPLYARNKIKAPFFTIALGDTSVKKDLLVSRINHNQLAYLNNIFPAEIVIQARKLQGMRSKLSLFHENRLLFAREIDITQDQFLVTVPVEIKAERAGVLRYRAVLDPVNGDAVKENNQMDFFVEVLDSRQKVLILAEAPDPDVAAMRLSLNSNPNYEVEAMLAEQFQGNVKPYSLIILHQLPGKTQSAQRVLTDAETSNIPVLFIAGPASSTGMLNAAQSLVQFNGAQGTMNEVQAVLSKDFGLFTISDVLGKAFSSYEPLHVPYAGYKVSQASTVMLRQRIGSVETEYPLLLFQTQAERKSALLLGTGIWRWRMHDFAASQQHERFDEFFSKLVQYLCVRNERRNFRIVADKSFFENEDVFMEAEVYNASYELVNQPDVLVKIFDDQNREYPFTFSRSGNAYRLNAGQFSTGDYRYEGRVKVSGKDYTVSGRFVVKPVVAELVQTTADHGLLQTIAGRSGGKMIYPDSMGQLPGLISSNADLKPVSHSEVRLEELISLPWIFFILLLLLTMEWGIRKWQGSY